MFCFVEIMNMFLRTPEINCSEKSKLTSRLPWAVHRDLHALGVDGEDGGRARDDDVQVEALPPAAPSNEPQVVELGHVVLHDGRVVAQLAAEVLVIPRPQGHHRAVSHLAQRDHLTIDT